MPWLFTNCGDGHSLASGGLENYATGTLHQPQSILLRTLWERREMGDLLLGDRGFCSDGALASLFQRGLDSVLRLHQASQGALSRRAATGSG